MLVNVEALFEKYKVEAIWATVGLLFCKDYDDYEKFMPDTVPKYKNSKLNAFYFKPGKNEKEDKLHYANSLIKFVDAFLFLRITPT